MPAAAYTALLTTTPVAWVVLAEIQTRQALQGDWTAEGSGAYSRTWTGMSHPASVRPDLGLYLGVTAVYDDTTALTSRASLGAVQAAAEGFSWSGTTLYVKLSGGGDPDDESNLLTAHGLLRVATAAKTFSDQPPYDAQIMADRLPALRQQRPELLRGISSYPDGDLTLVNTDGFWDALLGPTWHWINNAVTFKLGGDALAYSDYETVGVMQCAKLPASGTEHCVFQLRSQANVLAVAFPDHTYRDVYGVDPEAGAIAANSPDLRGIYAPIWRGTVYDVPLQFVGDGAGGDNRFFVLDNDHTALNVQIGAIWKVDRITRQATMLSASDYTIVSVGGDDVIDIVPAHAPDDFEFFGDLVTAASGIAAAYPAGSMILNWLFLAGVSTADVNFASFIQANADNPARLGVYIGGGTFLDVATSVADIIDSPSRPSITKSSLCHLYMASDGQWAARVWDPSFDFANETQVTEQDLLKFEPLPQVTEGLVANVTVHYAPRIGSGLSLTESATSTASEVALQSQATEHIETCLVEQADADLHAHRLRAVSSVPVQQFTITTGPLLMNANVGDKIRVVMPRGPGAPTPFGEDDFDQVLEIESLNKKLAALQVDATVGNMRGLGERVRVIAPDGTPAWASATTTEKRSYAYIHGDDSRVDPADPRTYRWAMVW